MVGKTLSHYKVIEKIGLTLRLPEKVSFEPAAVDIQQSVQRQRDNLAQRHGAVGYLDDFGILVLQKGTPSGYDVGLRHQKLAPLASGCRVS